MTCTLQEEENIIVLGMYIFR
eukprot:COSAG05_NODE_11778_length_496_cov_93.483627_1_plen_20_part_01